MISNMKISRKLSLSFAAIVLITLSLSGIIIRNLGIIDTATHWNDHTYEVLERANGLISNMVNQETGIRGFLVSADDKFLEPYKAGQDNFATQFAALKDLTSDNPAQQQRLDQIKAAADAWKSSVAEAEIGLMRNADTREKARAMEASGAGKALMDKIRGLHQEVDGAERALLVVRAEAKRNASDFAFWTMVIGSGIAAACAIFFGWLLSASIAKPVSAMTAAMKELAAGNNAVAVPGAGRKDEIGDMAGAVQTFKDAAIAKAQLEFETARAQQAAEAERTRNEAERAEAAAKQATVVSGLGLGLGKLSDGDLAFRLSSPFATEYEKLRDDFNTAIGKLQTTISTVAGAAGTIRSGTAEISAAADDLSRRTEQQAASLEETAAALDEITATVKKTSDSAIEARSAVSNAKADAEHSGSIVSRAVTAMSAIESSSQQIGQIIGVIDEIAFQTNLLALNAGVEAARAGEAGRGFAVVASEVRALAQRSAEAAKDIKGLISASRGPVNTGVDLVGETGKALGRIVGQVTDINRIISEIAASAQEQAAGLDQVNTAINQMDQVTQQNAAMVEQSTAASKNLAQETGELTRLIAQFSIGHAPAGRSAPARTVTALKTVGTGGAARKAAPAAEASWEEF